MSAELQSAEAMFGPTLRDHPDLAANGWRLANYSDALFKSERKKLCSKAGFEQFKRALDFLRRVERTDTINREIGSCSWKHAAERWCGDYVSEGALIAAAIAIGLAFEVEPRGSAYFDIRRTPSELRVVACPPHKAPACF